MTTDLRYPIGKPEPTPTLAPEERQERIAAIQHAPAALRSALEGLSDAQLDTPYRPGGWTARQVAHHVADSHMNAYVRFRLAVTQTEPTICLYDESRWAELEDARTEAVAVSLALLDALHTRWVHLLRAMSADDFARTLRHPELGVLTLDRMLGLYAWHGRHHVAHVEGLRERNGW